MINLFLNSSINSIIIYFSILIKREQELQQRRQHVERLLNWQQRLDHEERDVLEMERKIMENAAIAHRRMQSNAQHSVCLDTSISKTSDLNRSQASARSYRKIRAIESSLTVLQNMPASNVHKDDRLTTSGSKLNKLWQRLTGDSQNKFNSTEHYNLTKKDLEQIYEEAKEVVLMQFNSSTNVLNDSEKTGVEKPVSTEDELKMSNNKIVNLELKHQIPTHTPMPVSHQYFDEDSLNSIPNIDTDAVEQTGQTLKCINVPPLNLNFSPESSVRSEIGDAVLSDEAGYYLSPKHSADKEKCINEIVATASESIECNSSATDVLTQSPVECVNKCENFLNFANAQQPIETTSTPILVPNDVSRLQTQSFTTNDESTIMIEDVSFPNIDIDDDSSVNKNCATTFTVEPDNDDQRTRIAATAALEFDDKYLSDDFESDDKTTPTIGTTTMPSNCLSDTESKNSGESNHTVTIVTVADEFENINISNGSNHSSANSVHNSKDEERSDSTVSSDGSTVDRSGSSSNYSTDASEIKSNELEQRLIDIDESLKDINDTIDKAPVMELRAKSLSPERSQTPPKYRTTDVTAPIQQPLISSDDSNKENENWNQRQCARDQSSSAAAAATFVLPLPSMKTVRNKTGFETYPAPPPPPLPPSHVSSVKSSEVGKNHVSTIRDYVSPSTDYKIPNKMPDIISEAEVLRRQQLQIEQEVSFGFIYLDKVLLRKLYSFEKIAYDYQNLAMNSNFE